MSLSPQNNRANYFFGKNIKPGRFNRFILLFFISTAIFAQTNGITQLPETYRTPLSDMIYDDNDQWRIEPEDKNPWRENHEDSLIKPRIKVDLFPKYNYDSLENPISNSLFQNENEIERPVSNILEYSF